MRTLLTEDMSCDMSCDMCTHNLYRIQTGLLSTIKVGVHDVAITSLKRSGNRAHTFLLSLKFLGGGNVWFSHMPAPSLQGNIVSMQHGCLLTAEEDVYGSYSRLLFKFFQAEGVMSGHSLFVGSADGNSEDTLKVCAHNLCL